jgi:hypothetical protein
MTIFYCLKFETPPTWRTRSPYLYPPGTGWPGLNPQALGSLFVASYDSQGICLPESESYLTTNGQSASLSLSKAPIWGLRPEFYYCRTVAGLSMWGSLSDERTGLPLQLLLAFASAVILGSKSRGTRDHILLSQIRDFPFRRLLRLAGLKWRYSTPPPTVPLLLPSCIFCRGSMFT